jgi:hypothetical protein
LRGREQKKVVEGYLKDHCWGRTEKNRKKLEWKIEKNRERLDNYFGREQKKVEKAGVLLLGKIERAEIAVKMQ